MLYLKKMKFEKYEACGNDFILIDGIIENIKLTSAQIIQICDRHIGIGADGLIIIEVSNEANFYMNFYNSDGTKANMCGNGARASVLFASQLGYLSDFEPKFLAGDGLHTADVSNYNETKEIEISVDSNIIIKKIEDGYFLNTGVAHFVKIVNDFNFDIKAEGLKISNDKQISASRTNVDFVVVENDCASIRTFEIGVEDITLSCGTGAVASAIVISKLQLINQSINIPIISKGGKLFISFYGNFDNLYSKIKLRGKVNKVFKGEIKI